MKLKAIGILMGFVLPVSIPERVLEALKQGAIYLLYISEECAVSIPERVLEALKLGCAKSQTLAPVVSIPERVLEALKLRLD